MTDPWLDQGSENNNNNTEENSSSANEITSEDIVDGQKLSVGFEDNFASNDSIQTLLKESANSSKESLKSSNGISEHQPLPDSETYLNNLERRLEKLKKGTTLVDALSEKREDCLRSLLQNDLSNGVSDILLELDSNISNADSTLQTIYRQIQPIQPVTVGETVHIVEFDQLEEQRLEAEEEAEQQEAEEDSPASR